MIKSQCDVIDSSLLWKLKFHGGSIEAGCMSDVLLPIIPNSEVRGE